MLTLYYTTLHWLVDNNLALFFPKEIWWVLTWNKYAKVSMITKRTPVNFWYIIYNKNDQPLPFHEKADSAARKAPTNAKTNKGKLNTLLTQRQKSSSFLDLVLERFRLSMRLQKCNVTVIASGFLIMCYRDSSWFVNSLCLSQTKWNGELEK